MKITVVGTGYVGLVTGTCFAEYGNDVICIDIDETKISNLNKGILPIYEPGLEDLVHRNHKEGRLTFTTDIGQAVSESTFIFIAVGTPPDEDGSADLKYVLGVAGDIGRLMDGYKVVVQKSTVPVGTAEKVRSSVAKELATRGANFEFDIVSNPEFLKEGTAVEDFMRPDRVVIGTDNVRTEELVKTLYAPFVRNNHPIIAMDIPSAEMTKYAANAMLATKISFMNEISRLCEKVGANIDNVRTGIGSDSRIGYQFLYSGIGYGGSCFPKDVQALIRTATEKGCKPRILEAVEAVNYEQKEIMVEKIFKRFGTNLKGKTFAIWGLAFKPGTDDMREAPARVIITRLLEAGADIQAFDPVAVEEAKRIFGDIRGITYFEDSYSVLNGADALVLVTEWKAFRTPDFEKIKSLLKNPVIFDGRNQYQHVEMDKLGFEYYSIGRGK